MALTLFSPVFCFAFITAADKRIDSIPFRHLKYGCNPGSSIRDAQNAGESPHREFNLFDRDRLAADPNKPIDALPHRLASLMTLGAREAASRVP
jgi:hypothetical protein